MRNERASRPQALAARTTSFVSGTGSTVRCADFLPDEVPGPESRDGACAEDRLAGYYPETAEEKEEHHRPLQVAAQGGTRTCPNAPAPAILRLCPDARGVGLFTHLCIPPGATKAPGSLLLR